MRFKLVATAFVAAIAVAIFLRFPPAFAGSALAATAPQKFAFCLEQRRICLDICKTFFRYRNSCTLSCKNYAHSCNETGCFHWEQRITRMAAKYGAGRCVDPGADGGRRRSRRSGY